MKSIILLLLLSTAAFATDGTWSNPVAVTTSTLTSTGGSTNLTWSGSSFSVGRELRLTTTVPGGFTANTNYFVVYASGTTIRLATTAGGTAISATSTISNGTAQAYQSWQTASNWTSSAIASGTDAIATFNNSPVANVPGISLDGNLTLGEFSFTNTSGSASDLSLISGSSSSNTLTFAVSGNVSGLTTPTLVMPSAVTRLLNLGQTGVLKIAGSQGLLILSPAGGTLTGSGLAATGSEPAKTLRITNVDWSSFSGGLTVERGYVQPTAANQLPAQSLTLGDPQSTTNGTLAGLSLSAAQSVDALNGNSYGRITGAYSLTVGANGGSGNYGGLIGQNFSGTASATSLIKSGSGTQTISGNLVGSGTVTVSAGTLLMSSTSANTYTGATSVSSGATLLVDGTHTESASTGAYMIASGGTLGGTGTISLSDSTGSGTGISVSGFLSPGDPASNAGLGTLALDGTNSTRPILTMASGGVIQIPLGVNFATSALAITNAAANSVVFNSNTINFSDTSGGVLYAGQYVLISGNASTIYKNLVTDSNGNITSGLVLGTGLSAYPGSTLRLVGNNIVLNLLSPYSPPAAPLDSFNFGNTTAESAHALSSTGTVLDTAGGLGQTCRHIMPDTFLTFTMTVNPATKNYLTVKLWGSDTTTNTLYLYKAGATTSLPSSNHYGFYNNYDGVYNDLMAPIYFNLAGVAPFPGRFYYVTFLIPSELINTTTGTVTLQLGEVGALSPYAASGSQEGTPSGQSVGVYAAYTGTDPYFQVPTSETQGTAPTALTPSTPPSISSTISTLQSSCVSAITTVAGWQVYGSSWSGINSTSSAGASFSPIGAIYKGASASSPPTLDQIAVQVSSGNAVNLRIPSYLAKAYVTSWSGHYHDATYLDRVVKALDFCCLMQGSNGGLSVYNGTGTVWVGAPSRTAGGSPLEGYGTQGLGLAFNLIYAEAQKDSTTNTLLQAYLSATISDGVNTLTRQQAWANLFSGNVQFLLNNRGHATNQDLAQMTAMWLENQAAVSLGSTALSTSAALQYVYSATGLAASPLSTTASQAGVWFSPLALPLEPWGTLGGGYDGNYGMGNCVTELVYLAELTGDATVAQQANSAITAGAHFFFPGIDDSGYSSWRKEETISTRTLEWPGRVDFFNDGMPYAASPSGLNNALAQRFTQIGYQDNDTITILASSNAHYVDSVGYALLNVDSYSAALQAPATSTKVYTEAGQPDFAWADPQGCTVAVQQTTSTGEIDRLYLELQWRRAFSSSSTRNLSTAQVDNIARIHYSTPTIDRTSTASMDSVNGFGGLYACRYGNYFVAMNLNSSTSLSYTMPPDLWGRVGKNLVTQASFVVPSNGVISVSYGSPLVFVQTSGPVVTTTAAGTVASNGLTSALSVAAADNTGASNLTYAWSLTGTSPAPVTFSNNGTNSAANTTATFSSAGTYNFLVTITDPGGSSTTSTVSVTVNQVFSSVAVTPTPTTAITGGTRQFTATAYDQFGTVLASQPSFAWSLLSGGGSIDATSGLYLAPTISGTASIQASSASLNNSATITISSPAITAAEQMNFVVNSVSTGGTSILTTATERSSVVGHSYTLQSISDLTGGSWQSLQTLAGTGSDLVFTPVTSTTGKAFYHLLIQQL
ncbi:MAG: hypothetical protein QM796_07670 [Chthoniobacteraceae bacterium]